MAHATPSGSPCNALEEPGFSIITATHNCKSKLDRTVNSVLSQSFKSFEYLVIDGGSQDGSREWLAEIKDPRARVFSEPDNGVYYAMNKGIQRAQGKYLFFLGAGDELLPGALQEISCYLPKEGMAIIYGNVLLGGKVYDGKFSKLKLCSKNICHQAIFYSRDVFQTLGNYDLKYRALADWAFNMKCFGSGRVLIQHIPITVAVFEEGGISGKGDAAFDADRIELIRNHLGSITCFRYEWPFRKKRLMQNFDRPKQILKKCIPLFVLKAKRKVFNLFQSH